MEEWKEYRLGDISSMKYGKLPPTSNGGIYPVWSGYRNVGTANTMNCSKGTMVVVARGVGGTGDVKIAKEDCYLTNLSIAVILDESICNPYYLHYKYLLNNLKYLDSGSAQSQITIDDLKRLTIKLPSLDYQNQIVAVLKSFDDKIGCNQLINDNFTLSFLLLTCFVLWLLKLRNDNLEQQAQALFKSWFVDFEPFKDGEFVESELGMIPKGWKVGNLFDVAEVLDKYRKPLSGQERDLMDKIYPYYGATSCMDYVDDYLFDGIYTLIGEDGSVVKEDGFPYMQYVWGKLWVNNHAHILQGKNGFSTEMLHVMLSTTNIRHLVTGAVQAKLSQANMRKIFVAIPSINVLDEIKPTFDKLYQLIRKNEDESRRLAQLRDTLLPRLMSGELKVNEIERTVG